MRNNFLNNPSNTNQAFWVGMGSLSSFALSIISAAILSRYFDKSEYGTYRQILYVYNTLLVIFSAGLPRVFAFYLPRYPLSQGRHIVWKISKILFLFGLIFSLCLFFFSQLIAQILNNNELAIGLKYFCPVPLLLLPTLGIEGIFSSYRKTIYIAIYNLGSRLLMLLFIVLPVIIFRGTYLYAIYGWIIVSFITLILAYFFKGIPFKNIPDENTLLTYKEIFSYSMPLVTASLAGIAIKAADQFYISRFFGPDIFAEFANGFIELPFVAMITGATSTVLMPVFSKVFHEKSKFDELIAIWERAMDKSALIIYPLLVFFIVYAKEIVILLYSDKYETSSQYFQINMVLNFFNILIFAPLFFSIGKTRLYSNIHILVAILVWTVEYSLILIFKNPIAIAIGSTSINIIKILFLMFWVSKILKTNFLNFFPIKILSKYLIHSIAIISCVKLFLDHFFYFDYAILNLVASFLLFSSLLVISGFALNINYFKVIHPLINSLTK